MLKYVVITSSSDLLLYGGELFMNLMGSVDITLDVNFMDSYDNRKNSYEDYVKILIDNNNYLNHTYTLINKNINKIISFDNLKEIIN